MACDANTLLSDAASNGYFGLDDRNLRIATLQLLCEGGSGGGLTFIAPGGDPNGVYAALRPALAYDDLGNIWAKMNTTADSAGWTKVVTAQAPMSISSTSFEAPKMDTPLLPVMDLAKPKSRFARAAAWLGSFFALAMFCLPAYAGAPYIANLNGAGTNAVLYGASPFRKAADLGARGLYNDTGSGQLTLDWLNGWLLTPASGFTTVDWIAGTLFDPVGMTTSLEWTTRRLINSFGNPVLNWNGTTVMGDGSTLSNVVAASFSQNMTNWVNSIVGDVGRNFYFSATTNGWPGITNTFSMIDSPAATAATNSVAPVGNGDYFMSRLSTNTLSRLESGPVNLQTFIFISGGGGVQTVTMHPELYLAFSGGTTQEVATAADQVFTEGSTPQVFNIAMNIANSTNLPAGTELLLRWKATAAANTPTVNFVIGGDYDSHLSVPISAAGTITLAGDVTGSGIEGSPIGVTVTNVVRTNVFSAGLTFSGPTNALTLYNDFQTYTAAGNMALTNLIKNNRTWTTLVISNSLATSITNSITDAAWRAQGPNTTNSLVIPSGKCGIVSVLAVCGTNYATCVQQ